MSKKTEHCRSCGSKALTPAFSLGGDNGWVICDQEKDPTACGLVQRAYDMPAAPLRERRISRTVRHRLRAATAGMMEMISARDAIALDIGCGDGTLLSFLPRWIDCCGIDAHLPLDEEAKWGHGICGAFPAPETLEALDDYLEGRQFDIITAMSVLGEQADPVSFLRAMKERLAHDGLIMIETAYASLALMRNNPAPFNANVEAVFTLTNLEDISRRAGLKIVRGGMSESDGGSLRLFMTHDDCVAYDDTVWLSQLARLWDEETALALTSVQTCQAFSWRMERNRQQVQRMVEDMIRHERHAHVIGADAGQLALLDWFGIDGRVVSAIISRDPALHGREVVLGGVPVEVLSERETELPVPDMIIAPAAERRESLEHWREAIFDGAQLAILTPELNLIDDMSYGTELGKALAVTDGPGSVDTLRAVLSSMQRPQLISISTGTES